MIHVRGTHHFLGELPEGGYFIGEAMHDQYHFPWPAAARPARAARLAAAVVLQLFVVKFHQ